MLTFSSRGRGKLTTDFNIKKKKSVMTMWAGHDMSWGMGGTRLAS